MRHIKLFVSALTVSLFLASGLVSAQHVHDDSQQEEKLESPKTTMTVPMQQRMMADKSQGDLEAKKEGHESKDGQCSKMKSGMMGKGMKHEGMMGKGMKHEGMMAMMQDPVFKALHGTGCPGFLLKSGEKLALSEKQITELKKLKNDFKKTKVKNKADIDVAAIELKELLDTTTPDFDKVKAKVARIGSLEQELRLQFLDVVIQSRKILTAEQLKTLQSLSGNCCQGMGDKSMGQGMMK